MSETIQPDTYIKALILDELSSYPRFRMWVEANYQIHVAADHEEQRIGVKVIEEEMSLAHQNLQRAVKEAMDAQADSAPKIELADASVLKKLKV